MTGAHHSRELISIQMTLFALVRLLHGGIVGQDAQMKTMLKQNKYYFIPVVNVDGLKLIEDDHNMLKVNNKIMDKRKNVGAIDNYYRSKCDVVSRGVDLNRNYGVDWDLTAQENIPDYECSEFYAGPGPFSERET